MKIFVVAAIHGNEVFGLKVVGRINRNSENQILIRVGHPEAIAKHKRYIEEDLNRSFNSNKKSLEVYIANDIRQEIKGFAPDVIIDIHTSSVDVGKVAIVSELSPLNLYLADYIGMEAVVIMPKYLTKSSLIGVLPDRSISLEFGINNRSDKLASEISMKIESANVSKPGLNAKIPVFEVYSEIKKDFNNLQSIRNLVFNRELGGYPFLAGPNAYESIGGFLARKIS